MKGDHIILSADQVSSWGIIYENTGKEGPRFKFVPVRALVLSFIDPTLSGLMPEGLAQFGRFPAAKMTNLLFSRIILVPTTSCGTSRKLALDRGVSVEALLDIVTLSRPS